MMLLNAKAAVERGEKRRPPLGRAVGAGVVKEEEASVDVDGFVGAIAEGWFVPVVVVVVVVTVGVGGAMLAWLLS